MMNFLINFITNQISDRVTSWNTTIPAGLIAYLDVFLTHCGVFDDTQIHSLAFKIAQWLMAGLSLVLLAWKDRKEPPEDNTPTPGPGKDQ
jgi:hypothetical protein